MREGVLLKAVGSGLLWALMAQLLFGDQLGFETWWMLTCGALTGVGIALLVRIGKAWRTRRFRILVSIPVLFLAQALWAFLVTLPVTREGSWPERWYELILGIYWMNVFGFFLLAFAPLTYWNITWVVKRAPSSTPS